MKWKTLKHNGVLFPPDYEPHGIRMRYDGQPVDLNPEQEEVWGGFVQGTKWASCGACFLPSTYIGGGRSS